MKIVYRKGALKAIDKVAAFVESKNTAGSGNRWAEKIVLKIESLATSKAKFAVCKHPSLAKYHYRCYTYNDWVIAFLITDKKFEVCRIVWGSLLH
jgi:hypothetical protein